MEEQHHHHNPPHSSFTARSQSPPHPLGVPPRWLQALGQERRRREDLGAVAPPPMPPCHKPRIRVIGGAPTPSSRKARLTWPPPERHPGRQREEAEGAGGS